MEAVASACLFSRDERELNEDRAHEGARPEGSERWSRRMDAWALFPDLRGVRELECGQLAGVELRRRIGIRLVRPPDPEKTIDPVLETLSTKGMMQKATVV